MRWLRPFVQAPLLCVAGLVAVVATGVSLAALRSVPPLSRQAGFAAAQRALLQAWRRDPDSSFVVVWPPQDAAALDVLSPKLRAADAVPLQTPQRLRYDHVFVLGPAGFSRPPELARARRVVAERFGAVELRAYTYPGGMEVLYDLRAHVPQVRVQLQGPPATLLCNQPRADGGWNCPGRPPWNHVGPVDLIVNGADWPAVWAHPVQGHTLVLDLGTQQLGDRIELDAALADEAAGAPGCAAVRVTLEIGGVGDRTLIRPNTPGIAKLVVPTPSRRAEVRVLVQTRADPRRHLGINLRIEKTLHSAAGGVP